VVKYTQALEGETPTGSFGGQPTPPILQNSPKALASAKGDDIQLRKKGLVA